MFFEDSSKRSTTPGVRLVRMWVVGFALAVVATGCATVKPYERETLARPDMEFAGNPDASAGEQHAVAYREGSSGGFGASGGGCGCN